MQDWNQATNYDHVLELSRGSGAVHPRPTFLYLGTSHKIQKFTSIIASLSAASYPGPTGELINIVKRWEKSEREGKIRDGWWLISMSEIL